MAVVGPAGESGMKGLPGWDALVAHHAEVGEQHLKNLFAADPDRGERMAAEAEGLFLDYSKNRITDETIRLLVQLADDAGLRDRLATLLDAPTLPTGAGHDAGVLSARMPTAMLFVRNPTGVSHSPAEFASDEDCAAGVDALAAVVRELAPAQGTLRQAQGT